VAQGVTAQCFDKCRDQVDGLDQMIRGGSARLIGDNSDQLNLPTDTRLLIRTR
jgi:hypothetical protein